ncbi:unnamed protein product, partial [Cuscuta campestris]
MVNNMDHGLPKFSLLGYDDWKIMMEAHLYALHDCLWMVLEDGPLKIQMENPERNPATPDVVQYILKPKEKWDDRDCKKHNLDNVAKAAIFKTLDPITFSKIKHLKTAMEIWQEKNVRLLRSLPNEWYTKATTMEEGRNLENYTVQGLLDELRTYEHELKKKKEEQVTPFPTALMTTPRVPSSEGTCPRNCDTPSSSQPSSSKMENYNEEFAMMVKQFRKFKKFFKKADSVRRPSKGKPQHDHEVLDLSDKDEEVNKGDRMKPSEFIPFRSLPLKISQRNPDSDSAEPSGNFDQPSNIPDISNGDNSGNGDPVPIHSKTPTTSVLQPEAELDQPVNPNQHNLRWLRDHPPQQIIGDIQSGVRTRSAQQNLEAMLACFISQVEP